jgi:hypothetical protein
MIESSQAHIATWTAAGLSAEEMVALAASPLRDAVEAGTNRRAAVPYQVLSPAELELLVSSLESLPI